MRLSKLPILVPRLLKPIIYIVTKRGASLFTRMPAVHRLVLRAKEMPGALITNLTPPAHAHQYVRPV